MLVSAPLKDTVVGKTGNSLWLLYGSVSVLLLIACSNIAALLLARTADREREVSVRFSLGASRALLWRNSSRKFSFSPCSVLY